MQDHDTMGNPWATTGDTVYELSEIMIQAFGINEAWFLEKLRRGIEGIGPRYKDPRFDDRGYFDGRYWIFLDHSLIQGDFPWLSIDAITRMLDKLKESGVLLSCLPLHLNEIQAELHETGFDQYIDPRFYSINYHAVDPFILYGSTAWPGAKDYGHE